MRINRRVKALSPLKRALTFLLLIGFSFPGQAQETRGTIFGAVHDTNGAVVAGAAIMITNTATNVSTQTVSNESGAFEIPYLVIGDYSVTVSSAGFKKFVQSGVKVSVGDRVGLDVKLEIGDVSEEVVVSGVGPALDTTSGSGSTTLLNSQIRSLPVFGNSTMLLARSVPGVQWTGQPNYISLHSVIGASQVSVAGGVGGTEYQLDGVPNSGSNRRPGFLPYTDAVEEMKISSAEFDASKGHTSGATISLVSKGGTNEYHGSLTGQHWQQRFNGTQATTNAAYWGSIKGAEASGNTALADELRQTERQSSGRSNNYAATLGGPIRLPYLFNGRDKLFFFFSYNGYHESKTDEQTNITRTVPTVAQRNGDFSDLLALGPQFQIYDPRTARVENGHVVRDPFPDNKNIPVLNPLYDFYVNLYPLPNNVPGVVGADGSNNFLATATPWIWEYKAYTNRIDWVISPRQKVFGKWSWNDFLEDKGDWTYPTARGLQSSGLVRRNAAVTLDDVFSINASTVLNLTVGYNRFIEGNELNATQLSGSPSGAGLPGYIDEKAGEFVRLPRLNFSAYSSLSDVYPGFTRASVGFLRGELSKTINNHSLRIGADGRLNYRASFGPGNSSGSFTYNNTFVKEQDNTNTAAAIGLEWAAFRLGVPSSITIDTNDTLYATNSFYGFYVQDDWRVSPKLTLNLGFRYEIEGGFKERYNRAITQFDENAVLPISAAAEAAYAASPLPELPASQFVVRGGALYLGSDGAPETLNKAKPAYMPRIGVAYQLNEKTVIRGGYGLFYDTNNVLNNDIDQSGFDRATNTILTNDNGLTFNNTNLTSAECLNDPANCQTILSDPFFIRSDGTRFNDPFGSALGLMSRSGQGFTFVTRDWERARQQRWRFGIERQFGSNTVLGIAYLGSYTDQVPIVRNNSDDVSVTQRLDALPEQFWWKGNVRNDAVANDLNSNVPNPFFFTNFSFLETQDPLLWQYISTTAFFTSPTIRKSQLLRPFPQENGLSVARVPLASVKYHHMEASLTQRFTKGVSYTLSYTWASSQVKDFFENQYDTEPIYRPSTNYAPHHLMFNAVYELPFGKGKSFFSKGGILSSVLGGWQLAPIYHLQSGRPYDFGNLYFYGDDLHDIELSGDDKTTDQWFNWKLFPGASRDFSEADPKPYRDRIRQIVPPEFLPPGKTYDTVVPTDFRPADFQARVFPSRLNFLRGDIMSQLDVGITRKFNFTEGVRGEFKTDLINALNSVQWDVPNTDITSSNFGKVTQQWNTPRWIQFQLRILF